MNLQYIDRKELYPVFSVDVIKKTINALLKERRIIFTQKDILTNISTATFEEIESDINSLESNTQSYEKVFYII